MSNKKTLADMMNHRTKLDQCPFCPNTHEVYDMGGQIDCFRCGTRMPETTLGEGGKTVERELTEEEELRRNLRDCLKEDQKRGKKGGGSSSGPSRKKRAKRKRARHEQDAVLGGPQLDKKESKRFELANSRVKLYIPGWFKSHLETECWRRHRIDNQSWPLVKLIRTVLQNQASKLKQIKSFEYGQGDRVELQLMLYPSEKHLLNEMAAAFDSSQGEIVAACFNAEVGAT